VTDVEGVAQPDPSAAGEPGSSTSVPTTATEPSALSAVPREVVRQSADAIVVTDLGYIVVAFNPAAERLYGISEADALHRPVGELWTSSHVDDATLSVTGLREHLDREGSWRGRVVQRPAGGAYAGREVVVDMVATLLRDGNAVTGILVVNRDVTASARLEAEIATLGSLVVATDRARSKAEVAATALEVLCRATGAEAGLVTSMDRAYEATAHRGIAQRTIDVILSHGQLGGPIATALQAPDAYINAEVATAPLREDVRAAVLDDGIRHLVVVGLRLSSRLLGVLSLGWRQPHMDPPSKAVLLQAAALIAAALENARLLEAVESGLAQERTLTRRFRALLELTRLPDAAPTEGLGLERLVADIDSIIGADAAVFTRLEGDRLTPLAIDRVDRDQIESLLAWPPTNRALAARLAAGQPSFIGSPNPDPDDRSPDDTVARAGYRTVAAFPIREDGRLTAVLLSLFRQRQDELDIDERTLEAIGRVLDISFVNRSLRQVVAASETRYRSLFERAPDALMVETTDGSIVDANPAAHRLYGGDPVGRHVDELIADGYRAVDPLGAEFRQRGVVNHAAVGRRPDGSTFPAEVDLHAIDIDGESRILVIVRDVTERTRLQGELVQAQKMEAIGQLVAGVAHELNNPLASIVAFSQLLRTDPQLPEDLRVQAEMLVQEANRTRVIVQNLLDFARARPAERVATALRPLVDGVLALQSYSFGKDGLEVVVDIPADLPPIRLDRAQMQQVLVNLTVNAAQALSASGQRGTLRIAAETIEREDGGSFVRIEVSDDGPGVPPELTDRLFMPFVTTKAPGRGTGLGLSVSFGIVAGHGGTLRHEPGRGGLGASFVIELPLAPGEASEEAPAGFAGLASAAIGETSDTFERPQPARPVHGSTGQGAPPQPADRPMRVLVLDDETAIREFLGRALRRAGYEPLLAPTGAEALEMIRHESPDAILCDHRMAGMNGTEFHDAVAATDSELSRRFAFMSGDVLNPELREFATARGILLLAKPFDIATVGRTVAALLGSDPAA
jgi:PAS domain S-box-containing protein